MWWVVQALHRASILVVLKRMHGNAGPITSHKACAVPPSHHNLVTAPNINIVSIAPQVEGFVTQQGTQHLPHTLPQPHNFDTLLTKRGEAHRGACRLAERCHQLAVV